MQTVKYRHFLPRAVQKWQYAVWNAELGGSSKHVLHGDVDAPWEWEPLGLSG